MSTDQTNGQTSTSGQEAVDYSQLHKRLRSELLTSPTPERVKVAREECEKAAEEAPRREDRALFCQVLAQHCSNHAESLAAFRWVDEAERFSKGIPKLETSSAYVRATLLHRERRGSEARAVLEPYLAVVDAGNDLTLAAKMFTLYAGVLDSLGDIEKADDAFRTALHLREEADDPNGLAVVYYNYAEFCAQRSDDIKALEYFVKAYDIEKELGLDAQLAQSACQISVIHAQQKNREKALGYYSEAQKCATRSGVPMVIALTKANGAALFERLGDQSRRLTALLDAKTYLDRYPFDSIKAMVLGNLALMYIESDKLDEAEPLLERALAISTKEEHKYAIGYWLFIKGKLRNKQERYEEGIALLEDAVRMLAEVKAHVYTLKAFGELAQAQAESGFMAEACRSMAQWAQMYIEEHDADVENRFRRLTKSKERDLREQEAEIFRLKNVELSSAMESLEKANVDLRDLAMEKDEFMTIAAHDLRTPLADLRSMLQTVIGHFDVLEKQDILDISKDLLATTTRMSATVHAFLEISRSDRTSSGVAQETVDLVHLAHRAIERHTSRAEGKGITLQVKGAGQVWATGDASIIDAVLDNLLSNAVKYSPPNTDVEVDVYTTDEGADVKVRDHGPGISDEDTPKLFTKYATLKNQPTGGEESLGLGLYLAKRMAERIHASLQYEECKDGGSCFILHCQAVSVS